MKHLLLLLLLLGLLYTISGASQVATPTTPSADVYNYSKYADVPPNLFTGAITESIPFGSVASGPLTHDIGLSYYFSGQRSTDISSPVGLGWNMVGGGAVTRQIMGLDDFDEDNGWLERADDAQWLSTSEEQEAGDGTLDTQSDIYSINVGGLSAKFVFDKEGNCVTIPRSDITVTYHKSDIPGVTNVVNQYFLVTDADGVVYKFGTQGLQENNEVTKFGGQEYVSAWYLSRIGTHDNSFAIFLFYEAHNYNYYSLQDCEIMKWEDNGGSGTDNTTCPMLAEKVEIEGHVLYQISGSNNYARFFYGTRDDLQGSAKRLRRVELHSGSYSKEYGLYHSYFEDMNPPTQVATIINGNPANLSSTDINNSKKKLQLLLVTPSGGGESLPSYAFQYYRNHGATTSDYTCTSLLSKAYDAYGFANGAFTNNGLSDIVPMNTTATSEGYSITYGSANRNPNENYSICTGLYRMELPTGGEIRYEYEGHNYLTTPKPERIDTLEAESVTCSFGTQATSNKDMTFTQDEIDNGYIDWVLELEDACAPDVAYMKIRMINTATGIEDYSIALNANPLNNGRLHLSNMNLIANQTYNVGIIVREGKGEIDLYRLVPSSEPIVGGVRVKRKVTSANDGSDDIIRSFTYINPYTNMSSGSMYREPQFAYGFSHIAHLGIGNVLFSTAPVRPFSSVEGTHIGYKFAQIDYNGNGTKELEFLTDPNFDGHGGFPPLPEDASRERWGQERKTIVKTEAGLTLEKTSSTYSSTELGVPIGTNNHVVRKVDFRGVSGARYFSRNYQYKTGRFRPAYIVREKEGITSRVDYTYLTGTDPYHYQPTDIKTTFEDGAEYLKSLIYTVDIPDTAVQNKILERNMILPYVESNRIKGKITTYSKRHYDLFSNHPRLSLVERRDFDNGLYSQELDKYLEYNGKGQLTKFRKHGAKHDLVYVYSSAGLLLEKGTTGVEDLRETYTYYPSSTLLHDMTAIDGIITEYEYDGMMRLKKVNYANGSTEEIDYNITKDSTSHIKLTNKYLDDLNGLSALKEVVNEQYIDGLGREYRMVGKGQTQSGKDLIEVIEYDNQGRVSKKYESVTDAVGDSTPYTLTTYEPSPLNRVSSISSADNDPGKITYQYGTNSSIVTAADTFFFGGDLFSSTIIDGNGNKSITYTDSRGRKMMERRSNSNNTQRIDTKFVYDWKDRNTEIVPPGSTISNAQLNYFYEYTKDNKIHRKKVPSKDWEEFVYDERDIIIGKQDGYLRDKGLWYGFVYDDYDREIQSGFNNTKPDSTTTMLTTVLKETIYGMTGREKGHVKRASITQLGTNNTLISDTEYDVLGRIDKIISDNHTHTGNERDTITFFYDGSDNVVSTKSSTSSAQGTMKIVNRRIIDDDGRTIGEKMKIDNQSEKKICTFSYDDEGQLDSKYIGGDSTNYLQKVDYTYLESGMLSGVNLNRSSSDLFGYRVYYDEEIPNPPNMVSAQHNGNISGIIWNEGATSDIKTYSYDYLDRLTESYTPSAKYNTSYSYDNRGNFNSVTRKKGGLQIDSLSYNYNPSDPNELFNIDDHALGDPDEGYYQDTIANYLYDGNGNMTRDPQKGITMVYNHLDLPDTIFWDDGRRIIMSYLSDGTLIRRTSIKDDIIKVQDYIGGIEYLEGYPYIVHHAAGRVINHGLEKYLNYLYLDHEQSADGVFRAARSIESEGLIMDDHTQYYAGQEIELHGGFEVLGSAEFTADIDTVSSYAADWQYEYDITDHLGNVRIVFSGVDSSNLTIEQTTNYFPYGGQYNNTSKSGLKSNYLYNGIEKVSDFGLDWDMARYRSLDGSIGRWGQVDPKAEALVAYSPYAAMNNNPISFTDPDGDFAFLPIIIGAAVGGTLGGIQHGREGIWKGALVGAVGGTLGQFGGGSLLGNIAWGAGEGAITGGLNSTLYGGNFLDGALEGAKWGAVFAAGSSGIEATGNAINGHGFRLNEGVIKNYIDNGQFQDAIDFVQDKYNLLGPTMTYDATEKDYGITSMLTGDIRIGSAAFKSPDHLKATIIHEYGHSVYDRVFVGGKWAWKDKGAPWNYGDGIIGYSEEIRQAGRMHINRAIHKAIVSTPGRNWTYGAKTLINRTPVNPVWHAKGVIKNKWWFLLPKRF